MIRTTHCRRCGQVLDAFVEFVPGLPLGISHQAVESRLENAQLRHVEKCPALRSPTVEESTTKPAKPRRVRARRLPLPAAWDRRREAG